MRHTSSVILYFLATVVAAVPVTKCAAQEPAPQLAWKFPGVTTTTSETIIRKQKITIEGVPKEPSGQPLSFADRLKGAESFETSSTLKFGFIRKGEEGVGGRLIRVSPEPIEFKITLRDGVEKSYRVSDVGDEKANDDDDDDIERPLKAFFKSAHHVVFLDAQNKFARLEPGKIPGDVILREKLLERVFPEGKPGGGSSVHGAHHREYLQLFNPPPMAREGAQWDAESTVHLGDEFSSVAVFQVKCKLNAQDPVRPNISVVELEYRGDGELNSTRTRFKDMAGQSEKKIPVKISRSGGKVEFDNANGQILKYNQQVTFSIDCCWSIDAERTVACKIECDWSHTCNVKIVAAKPG
jgi:hypothetical protein